MCTSIVFMVGAHAHTHTLTHILLQLFVHIRCLSGGLRVTRGSIFAYNIVSLQCLLPYTNFADNRAANI